MDKLGKPKERPNRIMNLHKPAIQAFIGHEQASVIRAGMRGEEGQYYKDKIKEIDAILDRMPKTGETDGQGDNAIAYLHYFKGSADAWITELDKGAPDDEPEQYQSQAFGLADLGYGPELGYVSIPELLKAGMEIDLHWTPRAIKEIK